ncbi:hypothetical protein [Brasilonema octagenarum]|uniref:hypothetical protein n=1 Tax=Brasilonema octagenarum TaxID=417105 RepID=UPI001B7D28BE|nr:hypothetical protein [Brasilonema octagenarum]
MRVPAITGFPGYDRLFVRWHGRIPFLLLPCQQTKAERSRLHGKMQRRQLTFATSPTAFTCPPP